MADYGLSKSGLRVPSYDELLENYHQLMRAEFGHSVDTGADSVWGHLSAIESQRLSAVYEILAELYGSFSVSGAEGVGLDKIADFSNVKRNEATYSTIEGVTCIGTPTTVITAGSIASVGLGGDQFAIDADATIGTGGTVDANFTAVEAGAIRANAGTLNTVVSGPPGWTGVVNTVDAQLGSPIESDTDFRIRRAKSLRIIGESTFDALAAQMTDPINGVTGISDILLVHNPTDTDYTGSGGLPPHSFEFTIEGGDSDEIAEKILELAPAGIEPYTGASGANAITKYPTDSFGNSHTVKFSRRDETEIWVHVQVGVSSEFNTGNIQSDKVVVSSPTTGDWELEINGVSFSYHAVTSGSITAVVNGFGGTILVTSPSHGLQTGDIIDISGTVSYNGTNYNVTVISSDVFRVSVVFVSSQTGSWAKAASLGGSDTAITIAAGLVAAIIAGDWVPVSTVYTIGSSEFTLNGDYEGCPFVLLLIAAGLSLSEADHVNAAGDQGQIIQNIVDYAEGDGVDAGIQGIGDEVYLWKYNAPVGNVPNVTSVAIYMENAQPSGAPTAGWNTSTIDIDNRHKALFDTTRVTVEIV